VGNRLSIRVTGVLRQVMKEGRKTCCASLIAHTHTHVHALEYFTYEPVAVFGFPCFTALPSWTGHGTMYYPMYQYNDRLTQLFTKYKYIWPWPKPNMFIRVKELC
jgi:hypothetical protein